MIEHLQDDHPKSYVEGCDLGWKKGGEHHERSIYRKGN
jgi:hypothetical protein